MLMWSFCYLVCCSNHPLPSSQKVSSALASSLTCYFSSPVFRLFLITVFLPARHRLGPSASLLITSCLICQQANEAQRRDCTYVGAHLLHHHFIILTLFCSLSHQSLISSDGARKPNTEIFQVSDWVVVFFLICSMNINWTNYENVHIYFNLKD